MEEVAPFICLDFFFFCDYSFIVPQHCSLYSYSFFTLFPDSLIVVESLKPMGKVDVV